MENYSVLLKTLAEELQLKAVHLSTNYDSVNITTANTSRPGLQLAGYYNYFDPQRIQLIGKMEMAFLESFTSEKRRERLEKLLSKKIPAVIFCHGVPVTPEFEEMAEKQDVTCFATPEDTSLLQARLIGLLQEHLAPRVTRHGVLMEVYGEGLLLVGDSGIGKSEAAVELIKRGHRLIADDAVEIKRVNNELIGTSPELIRYYMEIRGIGIIDVRQIFGSGAVKMSQKIDLVVNIEAWNENIVYDRMGTEEHYASLLGVELPSVTIPVKPGRNLAVILEVAAKNNRQKAMGVNSAIEFSEHIDRYFSAHAAGDRE